MMRKVAENRAKMLRCDVRCAKEVALLTQKRMLRLTTYATLCNPVHNIFPPNQFHTCHSTEALLEALERPAQLCR